MQVTFTLRKEQCPAVHINNTAIPPPPALKYLGLHLDSSLRWTQHIDKKAQQNKTGRPKSKRHFGSSEENLTHC
jgi:hypothetical protein